MSSKSTATKPAAIVDPISRLDQAMNPVDQLQSEIRRQRGKVQEAEQKLAAEKKELTFLSEKAARLAKLLGDARIEKELRTRPHDAKLLGLLGKCRQAPWTKFSRDGASDEQILTVLKVGWQHIGYSSSPTRARADDWANGKTEPAVWIDNALGAATFRGKALAAEVRRLYSIPQPKPAAAAAKKPAPAKASPAKTSSSSGGGQVAKPAAKKAAAGKPPKPAQTMALGELCQLHSPAKTGGEWKLNIDTIPLGLGVGYLFVEQIKPGVFGDENWKAGYDLAARNPKLNAVHPSNESVSYASRADALDGAIDDLILDLDDVKGRKLISSSGEVKALEALLDAIRDFQESLAKVDNSAAVKAHLAKPEPLVGSIAWAESIGFPKCNEIRAATLGKLPEGLRHLMRDGRANDIGKYTSYQPRLLAKPTGVGEAHAFTVEDGDGQIHAGHSLYFILPTLGSVREEPVVGTRYATMEVALRVAIDQMEEATVNLPADTDKERDDKAAMLRALAAARADVTKEAARGVGVQPAAAAKSKAKPASTKSNGKEHGKGVPHQVGYMPVGGAASPAIVS